MWLLDASYDWTTNVTAATTTTTTHAHRHTDTHTHTHTHTPSHHHNNSLTRHSSISRSLSLLPPFLCYPLYLLSSPSDNSEPASSAPTTHHHHCYTHAHRTSTIHNPGLTRKHQTGATFTAVHPSDLWNCHRLLRFTTCFNGWVFMG